MSIWEKARPAARAFLLASALAGAGLPCATIAGQPEAGPFAGAMPDESEQSAALPDLRPTLHLFAGTDEPFDLSAFARPAAAAQRWRLAARAIEQDRGVLARCRTDADACPPGALPALGLIEEARALHGRALLATINRAVNLSIRYRSDAARHGAPDAWAAPLAALAAGEGDCEDYAIAKYMALREAGVPPLDLRLVLVRDTHLQQDHAVLAARSDGRWLLLDNRRFSLVEDRDAYAYRPLAAFGPDAGLFQLAGEEGDAGPGLPRL
jgi:predicted transglutaminase-like cysteine proteinase